jgi:hypothetical protein
VYIWLFWDMVEELKVSEAYSNVWSRAKHHKKP